MIVGKETKWFAGAEVLILGYGGAGAAAAITAHDAGARVLILEKQPGDTPTRTHHTPNTRMSAGAWYCPTDLDKTLLYLEGMAKIAGEVLDPERREMLQTLARYITDNDAWLAKIGVRSGGGEGLSPTHPISVGLTPEVVAGRVYTADFPDLPGAESSCLSLPKVTGQYRHGAALFKSLAAAVRKRSIPVLWEAQATHLLSHRGKICGVKALIKGKEATLRASRAVILTCGGFEFSPGMKENFLRVNPVHFYGNPGNTGDGVTMAMEVGAALWHMNNASWRVTMKFPDFPIAFGTQHHSTALFVDRRGQRFTNERFKMHSFGYELTNYDTYAMCYPKVPSYWIFDEKRRAFGALASIHGACNPPGGIMGDIHYLWSADNRKEIDRGWIMRANTVAELAKKIRADADNNDLMSSSGLKATVKRYNGHCRRGEDLDFRKPADLLQSLEDPPYYAVKLWPGGPNTQGGPKRNVRGQVVSVHGTPIPRLYAAGELGSVWGMFYQGGGNIAECFSFGRIAGAEAAAEKIMK